MDMWNPNRIHRFKNLLAFLLISFNHIKGFEEELYEMSPVCLEAVYLRYLGDDLPTDHEYAVTLPELMVPKFDAYCERWVEDENEDEA